MSEIKHADLQALYEWLREPDWSASFGNREMLAWLNKRPSTLPFKIDADIARLTAERDTLLAERAGVSEAMVEFLVMCVRFTEWAGGEGIHSTEEQLDPQDFVSDFVSDSRFDLCGTNLIDHVRAALATPIPTPVDREAIRAEAFEEAAKIADAVPRHFIPIGEKHVRGLRGSDVAAAIRSAAKTGASR